MANAELEFFVHTPGARPQVIHAAPGDRLHDALVRAGVLQQGQDDILVFVGECEDALHAPADVEDGADEHDPVDANLTLEMLALHRHRHVHCHRCRRVGVDVNFGGRTRRRKFSPATTVSVVTRWARKALRLDDAAAAEYVLRLCGTNDQPRPDKHLGELVSSTCSLCFDFVKEVTPQG